MKNVGSTFEYEDARNKDLMRAYKRLIDETRDIRMSEIYEKVVQMPSERFWVSEERAAIVVSNMLKGRSIAQMRPNKREMFEEICRRTRELQKQRPDDTVYDLVFDVVSSPAPKFYLTPKTAKVIISRIKCQWYEQKKRKYRHLFM